MTNNPQTGTKVFGLCVLRDDDVLAATTQEGLSALEVARKNAGQVYEMSREMGVEPEREEVVSTDVDSVVIRIGCLTLDVGRL